MTDQGRAGYVNLPQLLLDTEPKVHAFTAHGGQVIAIVDLGTAAGMTMHVETAEGARALADVFLQAAELIDAARIAHATVASQLAPADGA